MLPPSDRPEKASSLRDLRIVFDPQLAVDPKSDLYVERNEPSLQRLKLDLDGCIEPLHAFLCGHRGSGKTTELRRLAASEGIQQRYLTIFLTTAEFGNDSVHLTHDGLLVEIGRGLVRLGKEHNMPAKLAGELDRWGQEVVKTFLKSETAEAEAGAKGSAWLAYFNLN